MSDRRSLSWISALRDLKADRSTRCEVREERLRTVAGLRGSPALPLSAWRGRSGRRYVVGVHGTDALDGHGPAVVIAVSRGAAGLAAIVSVSSIEATDEAPSVPVGATELHVHRLAESIAERAGIVADLSC